ncbi:MAG: hypothetical protein EKK64_03330 [Neisseriaceae bacterium]|nr:MAG: hypothetical protein EKK64_03330 [Neisseriaceae bacterium]
MDREQIIKEARTLEAIKNGYMGLDGKLCRILKVFGTEIISHGSSCYEVGNCLYDPYETIEEDQILTMDEDESILEIGKHFDAIKFGINLNITLNFYLREILVEYKGRLVYKEVSGELESYVPFKEWEDEIENLFLQAKKIEKKNKPLEKKEMEEYSKEKRMKILDDLRNKWGI